MSLCTSAFGHAGSLGRTIEDLVMLDSVMRTPHITTDAFGGLPVPVCCDAPIDRSLNLTGLKLGLPSNFGWVNPGLSGEVSPTPNLPTPPLLLSTCILMFYCPSVRLGGAAAWMAISYEM